MDSIGFRIRRLREVLNFTQTEFAKMFGVTSAHISAIEKGTRFPSKTLALFICDKTHINRRWLIEGKGSIYGLEADRDEMVAIIAAIMRMAAEREAAERLLEMKEYSSCETQETMIMLKVEKTLSKEIEEMALDVMDLAFGRQG